MKLRINDFRENAFDVFKVLKAETGSLSVTKSFCFDLLHEKLFPVDVKIRWNKVINC